MILKEALNNIAKHSGASETNVQIEVQPAKLTIVVKDNGKGFAFDPTKNQNVGSAEEGILRASPRKGLNTMRKRMHDLGGEFRLESHPGQGTRIELTVFLHK